MCGRYFLSQNHPKIVEIITKGKKANHHHDVKYGDVFPGQYMPILIRNQNKIYSRFAYWGYHKKIINARSETIAIKPLFKFDFQNHRMLVPISGFYEWDKDHRMYAFTDKKNEPLYLAGIYNDAHECVILTCPAKNPVKTVHHRMPIIINKDQFSDWLFDNDKALVLLSKQQDVQLEVTKVV